MSIPRNKSLTVSLEIALSGRDDGNLYIIQQQKCYKYCTSKINFFAIHNSCHNVFGRYENNLTFFYV